MSKHKFTPGPWEVGQHNHVNGDLWLSVLSGAFDITHNGAAQPGVIADSCYSAMSEEENLANANLISAVPELFKYAKDKCNICFVGYQNDYYDLSNLQIKEQICSCCTLGEIIKKALGESK